nr:putative ribonuclease H-like domain-containing protein [Tanacetum cinerariifolium]
MSNPHTKKNFVPRTVLMRYGFKTLNTARQNSSRAVVSINTARQINTTYPRQTMNSSRLVSNIFNRAQSHDRRPFNKFTINRDNNFNKKVNTVRENITTAGLIAVVSDDKGNQFELPEKGVIDNGCSRHMTGNMSYLSEYEEIDGGHVAFGGDPKGGKITSKGKISIDTECVFLSHNFKLLDESQVLLRLLRKNNMYNVDLKNVAPSVGKFDGNVDEGLLVRYSMNSMAFRVFNNRTRIVEETLHITFLKNKPNVARSGPTWVFDIDTLTKSMNYKPVVAGNQSNGSTREEEKKDIKGPGNEESEAPITKEPRVNQGKDSVNSTNRINAVSSTVNAASNKVNVVGRKSSIEIPDDPNMLDLEDISIFEYSNENVSGADADLNNMETTFQVSPIPTIRIHKDHPVEQIIRDIHSAPQTKRITKNVTNHEPKKRAIETKWIYKNKKYKRGIVVGNKKRLVAQGYTQEDGIDYDEVFAPVARIKAIRLFLVYASFKDFVVYQMDVKSVFLYGKIEEEVYVCQPQGFEDPEFPDRVYKVEKVLYGLHQAPRA